MNSKKKIVSLTLALTLGGVGGHYIDDSVEEITFQSHRYPLNVEYDILDSCISSYSQPLKKSIYGNKKRVCICALEKVERQYEFEYLEENKNKFLNVFEAKARECM